MQKSMETETLEKIGLTKNESIVYLTLVKSGTIKTAKILKKSGLNSGRIYDTLESLKHKGLISESNINGVKHFTASPPNQLKEFSPDFLRISAVFIVPDLTKV